MENETIAPEISLDCWAVVELMGHQKIAGKCSNVSIAGCGFIRVQVPAHGSMPEYTRDLSPKAVYAINPCDEAAVMAALRYCDSSPVIALTLATVRQSYEAERKTLPASAPDHEDDLDDDLDETEVGHRNW